MNDKPPTDLLPWTKELAALDVETLSGILAIVSQLAEDDRLGTSDRDFARSQGTALRTALRLRRQQERSRPPHTNS